MATEPGIRIHRPAHRWRRWLLRLVVLAGLGLCVWCYGPGRPQAETAAADTAVPQLRGQAAAASGAAFSPFWGRAREAEDRVLAEHYRRAGVPTATPPPGSRIDAEEWEARRRDARWCAEGGAGWEGGREPPPALAALQGAQQQLARTWARQLRQRGELQASVAAEWLEMSFPADAVSAARARARLQELARSSRQPAAVYMALQMGCGDAASCSPVPASLWAELEPDNRLAWLAQPLRTEARAAQRDLLARAVQAPQHIDYSLDLLRTLQTLPREAQPGLRRAAQQAVWVMAAFGVGRQLSAGPARLCKSSEAKSDSLVQDQCRILAQQLWRDGEDLFSHAVALGLAKAVDAGNPQWAERRAEQQRLQSTQPIELEAFLREHGDQPFECVAPDVNGQTLIDVATKGEWAMLQAIAAGRGALVPVPEPLKR